MTFELEELRDHLRNEHAVKYAAALACDMWASGANWCPYCVELERARDEGYALE